MADAFGVGKDDLLKRKAQIFDGQMATCAILTELINAAA